MSSLLRNLFHCCFPKRQSNDLRVAVEKLRDIIYITVPRRDFRTYFASQPQHCKLDPTNFMALFKYATDEIVVNPGPDYRYEKFVFHVDSEYIRIEGWVPKADIFADIKAARNAIRVSCGNSMESGKRGRDVICVDISGKTHRAEQMTGVENTTHCAAMPQYSKQSGLTMYSRHMVAS